ncbi:MAG: nitroreductase family protein [Treponema sp.]|jgi:nitroreductase|nr:nitroreductase family protein [Treponema sp.]
MGNTLEDLKNRRSIKAYKPDQIKDSDLDLILEAGTWAASGQGSQSAVIVAVQNKSIIAKIEELNAKVLNNPGAKPFYGAPTVLNVLVDPAKPTPIEDGNLVIGNLINAAFAAGIGSCYIYRAKEVFASSEGKELLKQWGLSENYVGIGHVTLGYPAGDPPQPKPRKKDYIIKIK